jgi:hypothetical protein
MAALGQFRTFVGSRKPRTKRASSMSAMMRKVAPQLGALERIDLVNLLNQPGPVGLTPSIHCWLVDDDRQSSITAARCHRDSSSRPSMLGEVSVCVGCVDLPDCTTARAETSNDASTTTYPISERRNCLPNSYRPAPNAFQSSLILAQNPLQSELPVQGTQQGISLRGEYLRLAGTGLSGRIRLSA